MRNNEYMHYAPVACSLKGKHSSEYHYGFLALNLEENFGRKEEDCGFAKYLFEETVSR